jgi:hypothetical protein
LSNKKSHATLGTTASFNKINKTAQKLLQFHVFSFKTNFFFSNADIETVTKIQHAACHKPVATITT